MAGTDKEFRVKNGLVVNSNLIWANNGKIGFNTATPDANVQIVGTANVSANVTIVGATTLANTLSVTGNVVFANTLVVTGNTRITNNAVVNGNFSVANGINVSGNCVVGGNTTLGSRLTVADTTIINGATIINATMTSTNTATFAGNSNFNRFINVDFDANITNTVNIGNLLNVTGNTTLSGTLSVPTANVSISNGTLSTTYVAASNTRAMNVVANSITVTGNILFTNTVVANQAVTLSNSIIVNTTNISFTRNSPTNVTGNAVVFYNTVALGNTVWDHEGMSGAPGQVLVSNGDNGIYWGSVGSEAALVAPGGASRNTEIMINMAGVVSSNGSFKYNYANGMFLVPAVNVSTNSVTLGTAMYVSPTGNVGLGVVTASNKLSLSMATAGADGIAVRNTSASGSAQTTINLATLGATGLTIGQNYTGNSAFIRLTEAAPFAVSTGGTQRLHIAANGNIAIGTSTTPAYALDVTGTIRGSGEVISTSSNALRTVQGNYGAFFRNDGASFYLLSTASGDQYGSWNTLRPFYYNLATGAVNIDATGAGVTFGGAISAGAFSGSTGAFTGTVGISSGGSLGLQITNSTWAISLINGGTSRVYNDNGSRWNFEHRPIFAGNLALDAGNFNSYTPTLSGTGATGNWNINSRNITDYNINQNLGTGSNPTFSNIYTQTFYDFNDTSYYVNPRGTSRMNYAIVNQILSNGWAQATVYYDSADNNYYLDPNGISLLNDIRPFIMYDRNNTGYYCDPNATSRFAAINLDINTWNNSSEGWNRLYYVNGDRTIYKGGSNAGWVHEFRDQQDTVRWLMAYSGDFYARGNVTAYWSSDITLKENITPLTDAIDKINSIRGVEFDWTEDFLKTKVQLKGCEVPKHDVGVIAQEIQQVLPEVVTEREDGTLAVRYEKIIPLLIEGIKDLSKQVEELKAEIRGK